MLGRTLKNHYRITQELGQGAFGRTYLAEDLNYQTRPRFVLKHLQPDYTSCRSQSQKESRWLEAKKFFEREAATLKKLGRCSSQIPTMEDYFDEDNQFYIMQEWIEGESLSKQLPHGKKWSQKETIQLLIEILEPLSFCHQEGVIHRDIKPDNLMRRRNGELVIIDFGAVREISHFNVPAPGRTSGGSVIGTPGYMPFEQLRGSPVLASDIYAVGAIGMQALTGLSPEEISFDPLTGIPCWREVLDFYVSDAFANVLNRMLATLPHQRYVDASEALAALQPLRAPVHPSPSQLFAPHKTIAKPDIHKLQGQLSQEIFTFESAKLQQVEKQVTVTCLGIGEQLDRQTRKEWRITKTLKKAERFVEHLGNGKWLEMVYLPPSPTRLANESGKTQPIANTPGFYLGRYPVTQEQYLAVVGHNPAHWIGSNLPVENISWQDALDFCQKLSAMTGKAYRIPSDHEWEYACRAGTTTPFHFGETITTEVANFGYIRKQTTVVNSFPANEFGLSDMHGNVWEWCRGSEDSLAPRILRGGSWFINSSYCQSDYRDYNNNPELQNYSIGFRVLCDDI